MISVYLKIEVFVLMFWCGGGLEDTGYLDLDKLFILAKAFNS